MPNRTTAGRLRMRLNKNDTREERPQILTPAELDRYKNLLVFARTKVEGFLSGKHKSPYRGSSAEFADYKKYTPGDDLSKLDYRVYGRTRRLYIREFEEETDMVVYLLVDTSASMKYAGIGRQSKYLLAARIAAALAYLMHKQGDKVALGLFSNRLNNYVGPGGTQRHLYKLVESLEMIRPSKTTGLAEAIEQCAGLFKKRGRIVILSDFLVDHQGVFDALSRFAHRNFEILLLQVLDPDERNLPAHRIAKFVDMETGEEVQVDPAEIRRSYQQEIQAQLKAFSDEADRMQMSYQLVDTDEPYIHAIETYLGFRSGGRPL